MACQGRVGAGMLFLFVLSMFATAEAQETYTVGGAGNWSTPITNNVNYTLWAASKSFQVGDSLVFLYPNGTHDVLIVNETAYNNCETDNPLDTYESGEDVITLLNVAPYYFICGFPGHCALGQKFGINVSAATDTTNSTTTTGSPGTNHGPPSTSGPSVAIVVFSLAVAVLSTMTM